MLRELVCLVDTAGAPAFFCLLVSDTNCCRAFRFAFRAFASISHFFLNFRYFWDIEIVSVHSYDAFSLPISHCNIFPLPSSLLLLLVSAPHLPSQHTTQTACAITRGYNATRRNSRRFETGRGGFYFLRFRCGILGKTKRID